MKHLQLAILSFFGWLFMIVGHSIMMLILIFTIATCFLPPFRILQKVMMYVYSVVLYVFEQIENAKLILKQ